MIQGGCPLGTGTGDPGYSFEDECTAGCTFDKKGLLAMANAGPNTNGSQFFITTSTPTYLNNKHTIFGEVTSGYEVVEAISKAPKSPMDKPLEPITIISLTFSEN
jgi:peptidyl-prolyl cis-trans isomerase A (cyclophilin A)